MPKYQIFFKAELENLTNLRPESLDDYDFKLKFTCMNCQEEHEGWVIVNVGEEAETSQGRTANLVMKCKQCKNEGTANMMPETLKAYGIESSGKWAPLIQLECRGLEPIAFGTADGWIAEGAETGTKFEELTIGESEEWAEYDEKASLPVGVTEIEGK
ncbi:hypothetical protein HKX48_006486, partial [Thoreauomyces humboldtii]